MNTKIFKIYVGPMPTYCAAAFLTCDLLS